MRRVVLAFSREETAEKIRIMLEGSGFEVCAVCHSRASLMAKLSVMEDALVIMGYKLPDGVADDIYEDMDGRHRLMSIVKAEHTDDIINDGIFVVTLPINRQILLNAIDTFIGMIERQRHRKQRTAEEKKIIEDAKAYLMENHAMTEEMAHRFIQKRSMDTGASFIDTARAILKI